MNERAGCYQLQPTGYKAFIPQNLPPQPALVIGDNLKKIISFNRAKTLRIKRYWIFSSQSQLVHHDGNKKRSSIKFSN